MSKISSAKRQLDALLAFVNEDIPTLTEPRLRQIFYWILVFAFAAEDDEVRRAYYRVQGKRAYQFKEPLQLLQSGIRSYLLELLDEASRCPDEDKWHPVPGRPWKFNLSFDIYFKRDGVALKPTMDKDFAPRAPLDDTGKAVRRFSNDFLNILQHRLVSVLADLSPLSFSIHTCPNCEGVYRATEKKTVDLCRRCLQRKTTKEYFKNEINKDALKLQQRYQRKGKHISMAKCRDLLKKKGRGVNS
jgi:hypothetical protein